jgi:hypothetical protein
VPPLNRPQHRPRQSDALGYHYAKTSIGEALRALSLNVAQGWDKTYPQTVTILRRIVPIFVSGELFRINREFYRLNGGWRLALLVNERFDLTSYAVEDIVQ